MTKQEVLNEIDKKIEMHRQRIYIRLNNKCFFDETKSIEMFEHKIDILEEVKEWINKIS